MLLMTVAEVLAFEEVRAGEPEVVAGGLGLSNPVGWVHVSELADIARLLGGGELLLSTGLGLPASPAALRSYVERLAGARVSGLIIELGTVFGELPPALLKAADRHALPLVALHREIPFVKVTQAVHARIISDQLSSLERHESAHRAFSELMKAGGSAREVVREAALQLGRPVVFEAPGHRVVEYAAAKVPSRRLLGDWQRRSRRIRTTTGT